MLHLDPLAPHTPQLPRRRFGALTELAASLALHVSLFTIVALVGTTSAPGVELRRADHDARDVRHIVFLARELPRIGGGGGGGGNQQPGPILFERKARARRDHAARARTGGDDPTGGPTASPAVVEEVPPLPSIVVDAKPLALGMFEQVGLPAAGMLSGASTGPGSGGGVGTGSGTGIGAGRGPGLGSGSGGGTGGGAYRPGGAVTAPRLLNEVKPRYTSEAMRTKIQGTVGTGSNSSALTAAHRRFVW